MPDSQKVVNLSKLKLELEKVSNIIRRFKTYGFKNAIQLLLIGSI